MYRLWQLVSNFSIPLVSVPGASCTYFCLFHVQQDQHTIDMYTIRTCADHLQAQGTCLLLLIAHGLYASWRHVQQKCADMSWTCLLPAACHDRSTSWSNRVASHHNGLKTCCRATSGGQVGHTTKTIKKYQNLSAFHVLLQRLLIIFNLNTEVQCGKGKVWETIPWPWNRQLKVISWLWY